METSTTDVAPATILNNTGFRFGGQNHVLAPDAVLDLLDDLNPDSQLGRRLRDVVMRGLEEGAYTRPYTRLFADRTGLKPEYVREADRNA